MSYQFGWKWTDAQQSQQNAIQNAQRDVTANSLVAGLMGIGTAGANSADWKGDTVFYDGQTVSGQQPSTWTMPSGGIPGSSGGWGGISPPGSVEVTEKILYPNPPGDDATVSLVGEVVRLNQEIKELRMRMGLAWQLTPAGKEYERLRTLLNVSAELFDPVTGEFEYQVPGDDVTKRVVLVGSDKPETGTLYDARNRPIRKFKLQEA